MSPKDSWSFASEINAYALISLAKDHESLGDMSQGGDAEGNIISMEVSLFSSDPVKILRFAVKIR